MTHSESLLPSSRIPSYANCAGLDRHIVGRLPRDQAAKYPYIQINTKNRVFNMIFDIDSDHAVLDWLDNVPIKPAYFVGRRSGGHLVRPHAVIKLKIPVDLTKGRQASLYKAIRKKIDELLMFGECVIDPITGERKSPLDDGEKPTTKNPHHPAWSVIEGDDRLWTLDELRIALDMPSADELEHDEIKQMYVRAGQHFDLSNATAGRHCMLFETLRGLAYAHKAQCGTEEQLYQYVYAQAHQFDALNNVRDRLPISSIKATARSISRWTWNKYTGSGEHRDIDFGACADQIEPHMSLRERQSIGGRHGVAKNATKHESAVRDALTACPNYTIKGLARELSMSVNTVRKYVRMIKAEASMTTSNARDVGGVKIVSSGVCSASGPDLKAERDGVVWAFWQDPESEDHYIDSAGARIPARYLEPYVIWRAKPPPHEPLITKQSVG